MKLSRLLLALIASFCFAGENSQKTRWWGKWEVEHYALTAKSEMRIKNVKTDGFEFCLNVQNGAHSGEICDGFAKFTSKNSAIFEEKTYDDKVCKIEFLRQDGEIKVAEGLGCDYFHGARATFDGEYRFKKDIFCVLEGFDDTLLSKLFALVAGDENDKQEEKWSEFLANFSAISYGENLDDFKAEVIESYVPGLANMYRAILMISPDGEIWGAYGNGGEYFTSKKEHKTTTPKTIRKWMSEK